MRLSGPIDIRLNFNSEDSFVDVNQIENYYNYALKFRFWGYFSYYACVDLQRKMKTFR